MFDEISQVYGEFLLNFILLVISTNSSYYINGGFWFESQILCVVMC